MDATLESAKILGKDKKFAAELAAVRAQVAPDQIGQHGQLQEWLEDVDVPNNNHRHMSPLFPLYPGCEITPATTNLYEAAKLLLKWRGEAAAMVYQHAAAGRDQTARVAGRHRAGCVHTAILPRHTRHMKLLPPSIRTRRSGRLDPECMVDVPRRIGIQMESDGSGGNVA